jgi:integrase
MSVRKVRINEAEVRWEVCVYTDGRGSKRVKRRFEKKSDADAFLAEYEQRQRELMKADCGIKDFEDTTFEAESRYWLERQGLRFSPGHLKRASEILKEILPKFGSMAPNQFHPERLSRFQSEQLAQGLRPAMVNRKTDVITAILNFSVRHRRIAYSPATGFRKLPEVREDMKFWERAEAERFLGFAAGKYPVDHPLRWIYVAYVLALNTALRAGEIWGLQPQDICQGEELLHIRRRWDIITKSYRSPKGKKSRYVPCNSVLRGELKRLIEANGTLPEMPIFQTRNGTPVTHDNFDDRFRRDVGTSGVKLIRFHDMRHTATTLMIAEGLDIKTVQDICGHKDISTTMKYVHLLGDSVRKAASRFVIEPEKTQPALKLVVES